MKISFSRMLIRIFGSRNERLLKRYRRVAEQVNATEAAIQKLTDLQMRQRAQQIKLDIASGKIRISDTLPEALGLIRESMDRHIGIRNIFNPDESFDPDQFDDGMLEVYDSVQRQMIATGESWMTVAIPPELYAAVRKIYPESRPPFRTRPFDVQIIGGMVLYEGKIAEMATGEGKTFVAPLACFLKVMEGLHCHVVTVNDYLVRRDSLWVKPAFENLGVGVGYIQSDMEPGGEGRKKSYQCDITYGTNAEFGFDFLRDNMKERADMQVQGKLDYAIVDEVDSILIDEARTPLIISGAAHDDAPKYRAADVVARKIIELNKPWDAAEKQADAAKRAIKASEGDEDKAKAKREPGGIEAARKRREMAEAALEQAEERKKGLMQYYEVEMDRKSVHLSHDGIAAAQEAAGVGSFYVGGNMEWPHLMEQALRAHVVYERDRDYVVEPGQRGELEVVIVDEYTGRKMVGRQWSEGLHQSVEAKERVPIKQETQTMATVTLQNFFKLYKFLGGMTGTAQTEAEEFNKIYKLEVVTIPTNRKTIREDYDDRVYRSEREKWESIIDEIKVYSDAGRPVLVGTTSVEKSEMLSNMLTRKFGVQHEVLNAKHHEKEAVIVAMAGHTHDNTFGQKVGNVTIATNMAGRGTDIKLAPETLWEVDVQSGENDTEKYVLKQRATGKVLEIKGDDTLVPVYQLHPAVKVVGGLHVIGTERHTARRIDNQLRGRSGRQGDPGSSRFYVSLQDDLMKMFAGEWTIRVLSWLGMEEGMAIEDKRISKGILRAQKKVEERNYLARKNLLDYDEVMDHQRNTFYGMRQKVLDGKEIETIIWDMIGDAISDAVRKYIVDDYVASVIVEWARTNFETAIEPEDIRGLRRVEEIEELIKAKAKVEADGNIASTLGEFMGENPDDSADWDTKSMAAWAQTRFQVELAPSALGNMDAHELEELIREAAIEQIQNRDCSALAKYFEALFAEKELSQWAETKFGIEVKPEEMLVDAERGLRKTPEDITKLIEQRARQSYAVREIIYPTGQALTYAAGGPDQTQITSPYAAEFVRNWVYGKYRVQMPVEHITETSLDKLHDELIAMHREFTIDGKMQSEIDEIIAGKDNAAIATEFNARFATSLTAKDLDASVSAQGGMRELLLSQAEAFFRKELTDLEQYVLISIFDQAWKDHLYAMDILKGSVGLHAFAERDPRVLYKTEGFRYFNEMMIGIRDKVTDLIFRVNVVGQAKAKSAYNALSTQHEEVESYGVSETIAANAQEMKQAAGASQGEGARVKTVVREQPKVGRNDLCPCGSGKKYKKCCGIGVE